MRNLATSGGAEQRVEFLVSNIVDYEKTARWVSIGWRLERASTLIGKIRERIPAAADAWDGKHPVIRAPWSDPTAYEVVGIDGYSWEYHDAHIGHLTLLASEAIHHIRSALDYVAYQLVLADTGVAAEMTQFPIVYKRKDFHREAQRRLPNIKAEHLALVEAVQPYEGKTWAGNLNKLSNRDKHKYPVDVSAFYTFTIDPSVPYLDPLGQETHRGYQIENAALSFRFIDTKGSDGAELEVMPTLEAILIGAGNVVVDILEALAVKEISIDRLPDG